MAAGQDGAGSSGGTFWLCNGKREVLWGHPGSLPASAGMNLFVLPCVLVQLITRDVWLLI